MWRESKNERWTDSNTGRMKLGKENQADEEQANDKQAKDELGIGNTRRK